MGFVFHPAVLHAVPEVPQADDSQVPVVNLRERLPTRRLLLIGGGSRSQNVSGPEAHEEQIGAVGTPSSFTGGSGTRQSELLWMWITKVVWRLPGRQMSIVAEIHVQRETPRQEPIFHPMSDTESVESVAGTVDPVVETTDEPEVVASFPGNITLRMALVTLDDPCAVFRQRAAVMKSVPHVLRGHFGNALKLALEEATWRNCQDDEVRHERRWKLIMLLPRMLLHRPPCGGSIPRTKLVASLEAFSGEWIQLFTAGAACDEKAAIGRIQQSRRRGGDDLERRVLRAERLVHVGELSSDR